MTITIQNQSVPSAPAPSARREGVDHLAAALRGPLIDAMVDLGHVMGFTPPTSPLLTQRQSAYRLIRSLSQHTVAVQSQLYPMLQAIDGTDERLDRDQAISHALLIQLRQLRGSLQGDYYARGTPNALATKVLSTLGELLILRTNWVARIEGAHTYEGGRMLAARLRSAQLHAPSRPHPYSPRSGISGWLSRRLWLAVDGGLDACDSQA